MTLRITNRGSARSPALTLEDGVAGLRVRSISLARVASGAARTVTVALDTRRRGRYGIGPARISYVDPLGLARRTLHEGAAATWVVHPRTHPAPPLVAGGWASGAEGEVARIGELRTVAYHSLREYVPGDDRRLIHWRSSARTGTLIVRHSATVDRHEVLIVLDTNASSYDAAEHFDDAVRVAASLALSGIKTGHPTTVTTTGGVSARADERGRGRIDVLDLLAAVATDDHSQGPIHAARTGSVRWSGPVGIVTCHPEANRIPRTIGTRGRSGLTVFQVGRAEGRPTLAIPGARVVRCLDAEDLGRRWRSRSR